MIRKTIRQMLTAQIFSALTVSLCLLIDNVVIGRFLGEKAMAAYGFANPLLLSIGAIGSMLAAGIQLSVGKSLGKGSREGTDEGYSSAVTVAAAISFTFAVAVILLRNPLARMMGAGENGEVFEMTRDYLAGFSIGAPGSMGALTLVPFLQMAGESSLLIAAVVSMTIADVALDLLNVLVFHGGMFGIGLASSLSYYVAMAFAAFYFLSRKCIFRFSLKKVKMAKIRELMKGGVPAGVNMAASVLLVFILNRILLGFGGERAVAGVAAYAVIMSIGNTVNAISTGIGGVSLTMAGILYNEEDRTGLRKMMQILLRDAVVLGLAVGAVVAVFSPVLVGIFLESSGEGHALAVQGLRLFAAGMVFCAANNALKFLYQATDREKLTEIYCVLEGLAFPAAGAFVLSRFLGISGVWLYFLCGEALALVWAGVMIRGKTGRWPWQGDAFLLLREGLGAAPEDCMEADIHTLEEVSQVSEQARQFCLRHGQSERLANHVSLCVEEKASNTIEHGFRKDGKNHLSLRILFKKDYWVLRFRDDCGAFDPVSYIPEASDREKDLGIRLIQSLAEEARYTYSLNMNNLMLKLPSHEEKA